MKREDPTERLTMRPRKPSSMRSISRSELRLLEMRKRRQKSRRRVSIGVLMVLLGILGFLIKRGVA